MQWCWYQPCIIDNGDSVNTKVMGKMLTCFSLIAVQRKRESSGGDSDAAADTSGAAGDGSEKKKKKKKKKERQGEGELDVSMA